jgi:hypothetical protein
MLNGARKYVLNLARTEKFSLIHKWTPEGCLGKDFKPGIWSGRDIGVIIRRLKRVSDRRSISIPKDGTIDPMVLPEQVEGRATEAHILPHHEAD